METTLDNNRKANEKVESEVKLNLQRRSQYEETKKTRQKELDKMRDELKHQQLRASQNERNKTNLESRIGTESQILMDEKNKQSKDQIMLKKLKEDFHNVEEQIKKFYVK